MTNIHLYTTYYNATNPVRKQEYKDCLLRNATNPSIDTMTVLNEGDSIGLYSSKIKEIGFPKRPSYNDFIDLIKQHNTDGDIHIVANTDIYFDENIGVLAHLPLEGCALALSRWNLRASGKPELFNRNDSQDVWVCKGPLRPIQGNFPLGIPFCDNRFLYELQQAGYKVLNPAFSIQSFHLHAGARSEYTKERVKQYVEGPYRYCYPHNFYSLPQTLWFNATHKVKLQPYRFDPKKMNRWWPIRMVRLFCRLCNIPFPLIGYRHIPL